MKGTGLAGLKTWMVSCTMRQRVWTKIMKAPPAANWVTLYFSRDWSSQPEDARHNGLIFRWPSTCLQSLYRSTLGILFLLATFRKWQMRWMVHFIPQWKKFLTGKIQKRGVQSCWAGCCLVPSRAAFLVMVFFQNCFDGGWSEYFQQGSESSFEGPQQFVGRVPKDFITQTDANLFAYSMSPMSHPAQDK